MNRMVPQSKLLRLSSITSVFMPIGFSSSGRMMSKGFLIFSGMVNAIVNGLPSSVRRSVATTRRFCDLAGNLIA